MEPYIILYQSMMILSLLSSSFVVALTWRYRQFPCGWAMIALAAATFIWTLGFYIEAHSSTLEQQLFFCNVGYIGVTSVPVAWFIFALHYTTGSRLVTGWKILPFCIIPMVTMALVWSNNWHHLMWYDEHLIASGPFTVTAKTYGIFFWIHTAYSYTLIVSGAIILVWRLFVGIPIYKGQAASLIVAVSLPLIWNFLYIFDLMPLPRKDLTPVMFAISGALVVLGLMRFQLLRAVPFARKFLIERLSDGVLAFDMNNRLLEANMAALTIFGVDKNIIGKKVEYLSSLSSLLDRFSSSESGSVELPLTVSGEKRFYELQMIYMRDSDDRQVGWLAILHDITERKQAEEALRESEIRFRGIFDNTSVGIALVDQDGHVIDANEADCRFLGYSYDDLIGMHFSEFTHTDDLAADKELYESVVKGERDGYSIDKRYITKQGDIVWGRLSVTVVRNGESQQPYAIIVCEDITKRKKIEEEIRRAAEEWRSTFDSISDAISIHGKDYEIRRVNKAFADIFHTQPRELLGKHCYEVMHGTKGPVPTCPHQKALQTGKQARAEFFEPNLGIYLEATTSPILDERGKIVGTVHVVRDITERKQQNERLMMANRLASIGELAAGTAHELNNPLTSVIGFSQLLMERDIPDDVREDLQLIYNEAQRAAKVTKNLLTFARKRTPEKQLNQINNIIEDVLKLRAYGRKANGIEVKRQLDPDLPAIMVDYSQLQQVFINIIINAEYFMTEAHNKGTLTITTKKQNGKVRVSIADDGPGIPSEHLSRMFDPFFTTKKTGKGTGLGLSICHGIVTEHGGQIYVRSQPGKGATFFVELPINSVG